jgi:hypothetical protein
MLNEAGVLATEISQGLCLHATGPHGIPIALEQVPLLSDDVAAYQVAGVHRYGFKPTGPPGADLFNHIVQVIRNWSEGAVQFHPGAGKHYGVNSERSFRSWVR